MPHAMPPSNGHQDEAMVHTITSRATPARPSLESWHARIVLFLLLLFSLAFIIIIVNEIRSTLLVPYCTISYILLYFYLMWEVMWLMVWKWSFFHEKGRRIGFCQQDFFEEVDTYHNIGDGPLEIGSLDSCYYFCHQFSVRRSPPKKKLAILDRLRTIP